VVQPPRGCRPQPPFERENPQPRGLGVALRQGTGRTTSPIGITSNRPRAPSLHRTHHPASSTPQPMSGNLAGNDRAYRDTPDISARVSVPDASSNASSDASSLSPKSPAIPPRFPWSEPVCVLTSSHSDVTKREVIHPRITPGCDLGQASVTSLEPATPAPRSVRPSRSRTGRRHARGPGRLHIPYPPQVRGPIHPGEGCGQRR
jgi:hypothetical protein